LGNNDVGGDNLWSKEGRRVKAGVYRKKEEKRLIERMRAHERDQKREEKRQSKTRRDQKREKKSKRKKWMEYVR
jgi:hypothetical protein